ncbi:response regulator receiver domain [Streptomyces sp. NPDC003554]
MTANLEHWSFGVARDYLQTVVVIDDQLVLGRRTEDANAPDDGESIVEADPYAVVATPENAQPALAAATSSASYAAPTVETPSASPTLAGGLDGAALSDAFAHYGLVCGYVRPETDAQLQALVDGSLDRLFIRSDVLVLDWSFNGDLGGTTTRLIRRLLRPQEGRLGRLRLICVYTNEPDLFGIRDAIARELTVEGYVLEESENSEGPGLFTKDFRISVLGKPGVSRTSPLQAAEVDAVDLPQRIVLEFAQASHGILPGFALKSLSVLRDNAPMLLQRFHRDLDPAFVSHDLLTGEGRRFALQLLAREVQSLLESTGAGDIISRRNIEEWVRGRLESPSFVPRIQKKATLKEISSASVLDLLSKERIDLADLRDAAGNQVGMNRVASIASLFAEPEEARSSEEELGRISSFARDLHSGYDGSEEPTLQLGTILIRVDGTIDREAAIDILEELKSGTLDHSFWICLQPLCDSEHIEESSRGFPMMPLSEAEVGKEFSFLARDHHSKSRALAGGAKPHEMKMVNFAPTGGEKVIRATKKDGFPRFTSDDGVDWLWVGELRAEQALRVSHEMARMISRVGLDESEWLRENGMNK